MNSHPRRFLFFTTHFFATHTAPRATVPSAMEHREEDGREKRGVKNEQPSPPVFIFYHPFFCHSPPHPARLFQVRWRPKKTAKK